MRRGAVEWGMGALRGHGTKGGDSTTRSALAPSWWAGSVTSRAALPREWVATTATPAQIVSVG